MTFLLWFITSLATLPLSIHSRHAKSWVNPAFGTCMTSRRDADDDSSTGVDVMFVVYVVVANFVVPLTLMAFFYSRIYRTVRLHKLSVILRDVLITEVVQRRSKRLMVSVVGVFAVMTSPLAVALPTTLILRRHPLPSFVVLVVWIMQILRTLSHPVLYGVCNTMFAHCMLRMLRCQGPMRHAGQGHPKLRGSSARPRPGSGNPMAGEVDQNEEISTIAPLPLESCHCPLCPQCNSVQQLAGAGSQQQSTTSAISHGVHSSTQSTGDWPPAAAATIGHRCKVSSCSHYSLGGRYSSRSSVPTILRMQLSQPRCNRSSSNCSQTSQMMVGGRTPCADSSRSSFFSQRGQTSSALFSARTSVTSGAGHLIHSSSSSSSSAATNAATAAANAPNDASSTSLTHYIYERCSSATLVFFWRASSNARYFSRNSVRPSVSLYA